MKRGERRRGAESRRWLWAIGIAGIAGLVSVPAGWTVSDALEADNDFCNACHLSEGVPLHIDVRRDFDGRPPASLAAAHGAAPVEARPDDTAFRCIDCHGGVGLVGRARVKLLAAKDAFWYVVGHFEEPDGMRVPLLDADCRQCHDAFQEKGDGLGGPAFHDLSVHNVELGVGCVECHLSHEPHGPDEEEVARATWFLHGAHVRNQCVRCHPEFGAEFATIDSFATFDTFEEGNG